MINSDVKPVAGDIAKGSSHAPHAVGGACIGGAALGVFALFSPVGMLAVGGALIAGAVGGVGLKVFADQAPELAKRCVPDLNAGIKRGFDVVDNLNERVAGGTHRFAALALPAIASATTSYALYQVASSNTDAYHNDCESFDLPCATRYLGGVVLTGAAAAGTLYLSALCVYNNLARSWEASAKSNIAISKADIAMSEADTQEAKAREARAKTTIEEEGVKQLELQRRALEIMNEIERLKEKHAYDMQIAKKQGETALELQRMESEFQKKLKKMQYEKAMIDKGTSRYQHLCNALRFSW